MPVDDRETWFLPSPDSEGSLIMYAHPAYQCAGRGCPLHGPSLHWARDLPLVWEYEDRGLSRLLRRCEHGVLHDDPDDWAFRQQRGLYSNRYRPCACTCLCVCTVNDPPF